MTLDKLKEISGDSEKTLMKYYIKAKEQEIQEDINNLVLSKLNNLIQQEIMII